MNLNTVSCPRCLRNISKLGITNHNLASNVRSPLNSKENFTMNRSRTLTWVVISLSILALMLAACAPQAETVGEAEPAAEEAAAAPTEAPAEESEDMSMEPIKIGALAPLSAPGAVVGGEAMREAMLIAAEELNARGGIMGRPVELIIVDTEGLPERGTAVVERLINQDGVVGIGGGYHSSVGVAAKEVARDNGRSHRLRRNLERHHHQRFSTMRSSASPR